MDLVAERSVFDCQRYARLDIDKGQGLIDHRAGETDAARQLEVLGLKEQPCDVLHRKISAVGLLVFEAKSLFDRRLTQRGPLIDSRGMGSIRPSPKNRPWRLSPNCLASCIVNDPGWNRAGP